jgi:3'(2'), 5'-bisphosphate nucleotidase
VTAEDHVLARELAEQAGRRLLELRSRGGDPDLLRRVGDRLSHEFLVSELAARRPGDVVLSEEGADDPARLAANRVWIVDPLDGTREFGEPGRTDWAVHVALWERSAADGAGDLTAGAVALPAQGQVLSTLDPPSPPPATRTSPGRPAGWHIEPVITGPRAHRAGSAAGPGPGSAGEPGPGPVRVVVSRTRAPRLVQDISDLIGAEPIRLGSAGAKAAAVVCGEADAYVHAGGFYEWDTAAPVAVARAAGSHASRIDGSPLAYNQADVLMPDILICLPAVAALLLQAIREVTNAR